MPTKHPTKRIYLSRSDYPSASKPRAPFYDHNLHSLTAKQSRLDRSAQMRFQRGFSVMKGLRP
jgi:hypothetical protein